MYPSSTLCRVQEAHQRDRAASTLLDNVRIVAEKAAAAWALEADAAERREARHERTRAIADVHSSRELSLQEKSALGLSENPDRGLADL